MADFPTSPRTFTTKNTGDVIQAAHINDLQDEVNAIEDGYLNATARLNSSNSTLAALSAGASTLASLVVSGGSTLNALQVSSNSTLGGNLVVRGGLSVSSGSTFANISSSNSTFANLVVTGNSTVGNLSVSSNSTIAGTLTVTGGSTLGTLQAGASTLASLSVSGNSTLVALTAGASTLTSLSVSGGSTVGIFQAGASTVASLVVSGGSTLGTVSAGASTLASVVVSGGSTLGTLQAGASTLTSLSVSGGSTLAALQGTNSTFNNLSVSSNSTIAGDLIVSGQVGIGSTAPGYKTDIRASATDFEGLRLLNTNAASTTATSAGLLLGITNSVGLAQSKIAAVEQSSNSGNTDLAFYTNTGTDVAPTEKVRITNAGAVGIGSTSPGATLSINGGLHVGSTSDPGDNNAAIDGTLSVSGNSTLAALNAGNSTLSALSVSGGSTLGTLQAGASTLTSLSVSGGSTLTTLQATNSTVSNLSVSSNSTITGTLAVTGRIQTPAGTTTAPSGAGTFVDSDKISLIDIAAVSTDKFTIGHVDRGSTGESILYLTAAKNNVTQGGAIAFYTESWAAAFGERLRITGAGDVGIGTTAPGAKLSLNGGLHVGGTTDPGDNNAAIDGNLQVTGASTFAGNIASTGTMGSSSARVKELWVGQLNASSGAGTGESTFTSLQVSGGSTLSGGLQSSNSTLSALSAGASTLTSLSVSGGSTLTTLQATNSTVNNLSVSSGSTLGTLQAGASTLATLSVSGASTLSSNVVIRGPSPWIDVRAFGANGSDTTVDNSTAFAAASSAVSTAGATLFIPPGTYVFSTTWVLKSSQAVTIQGAGIDVTELQFTSTASDGISWTSTGVFGKRTPIQIRDLTVTATKVNSGSAIKLTQSSLASMNEVTVALDHVLIRPEPAISTGAWHRGLDVTNAWNMRVHDLAVHTDNNDRLASSRAISIGRRSIDVFMDQILIYGHRVGIFIDEESEGQRYNQIVMVRPDLGIHWVASTQTVDFQLLNSHINTDQGSVRLQKITQGAIIGNTFYHSDSSTQAWIGINLSSASNLIVNGNFFLSGDTQTNRSQGVVSTGALAFMNQISNNNFSGIDECIYLSTESSGCAVIGNIRRAGSTTVSNGGGSSNIVANNTA